MLAIEPSIIANSYSASFSVTENPISDGGIWTNGLDTGLAWNNLKTESGNCIGASDTFYLTTRYADDIGHLKKSYLDFADNQYAQGTVFLTGGYAGNGGSHEAELLLRFEITANNARGYEVLWGITNTFAIIRWNGPIGNFTALIEGSIGTPVDGDVLRAEISGTTITVFKNGVQVAQVSDATYSEGQPGVGFWPVDGGITGNYGWKDFAAGNL